MIAASHLAAGAAIGSRFGKWWLAVPVAFASHFVLDQIPHSCFNGLPAEAWVGLAGLMTYTGVALDCAVIGWTALLAWKSRVRWTAIAAAAAAFAPDPLSYMKPLSDWFALVPGSSCVPWAHVAFHCDVTRSHLALGFATQAIVIGVALLMLYRTQRSAF